MMIKTLQVIRREFLCSLLAWAWLMLSTCPEYNWYFIFSIHSAHQSLSPCWHWPVRTLFLGFECSHKPQPHCQLSQLLQGTRTWDVHSPPPFPDRNPSTPFWMVIVLASPLLHSIFHVVFSLFLPFRARGLGRGTVWGGESYGTQSCLPPSISPLNRTLVSAGLSSSQRWDAHRAPPNRGCQGYDFWKKILCFISLKVEVVIMDKFSISSDFFILIL